jgi:hypothetical protein
MEASTTSEIDMMTAAQRRALAMRAFKPGEIHPRTVTWLLARGYVERDGVGGMTLSANMQGRGGHQNPLTYVRTEAGEAALSDCIKSEDKS